GISKVAGYELVRNYRETYGIFASTGILFNHESPRRGLEFVTRKITSGAARIAAGLETELRLGNLEAERDWGHSRDYVRAMWLMLQQDVARDFVIATGVAHSVRQFADLAFRHAGLDYRDHVKADQTFFRPSEVDILRGDSSRARKALNWHPETNFEDLVREMVEADCRALNVKI
ncbi:MAG TPA: GDP-mannose 4,6-dehydratase, partial [Bryobacteraceae bacterium]|nr:GDP-mannose 4,6-dehydratase [Bryobacteraceae bacterium]